MGAAMGTGAEGKGSTKKTGESKVAGESKKNVTKQCRVAEVNLPVVFPGPWDKYGDEVEDESEKPKNGSE